MRIKIYLLIGLFFYLITKSFGQQTIGLFKDSTGNLDGYVLFAPVASDTTFLIDKCGKLIHTWGSSHHPGLAASLLPDGNLLRCGIIPSFQWNAGGKGGIIEKFDWNGNLLWSYVIFDSQQCQHHDTEQLPNGNILTIAWEAHSNTDAINNGRSPFQLPDTIWSEKIVEIQPVGNNGGNIVWQWRAWDHLVQHYDSTKLNYDSLQTHPHLININYAPTVGSQDWLHINSVFYDSVYDQIILSVREFSEVWILDHSTTTAQAASHIGGNFGEGGDLLYRWGNPAAYQLGNSSTQTLFGQHDASIIPIGFRDQRKILVFNNGTQRPAGNFTSVDIFQPPIDTYGRYDTTIIPYLPVSNSFSYTTPIPTSFYDVSMGGTQRLSNGNTMICYSDSGSFFEIDTNNNIVWKYVCPVNGVGRMTQGNPANGNVSFRCPFYEPTYSGFIGHTLTSGNPIEINPLNYTCDMLTSINELSDIKSTLNIYPNPAKDETNVVISNSSSQINDFSLQVLDVLGRTLNINYTINYKQTNICFTINTKEFQNGVYICKVSKGDNSYLISKFVINK